MAIYVPGRRDRHNRPLRSKVRNVVAVLSLTAMVDMFTVLVVFLLQNYQTTGEVLELSDEVALPRAHAVKELRPAHVVVVKKDVIMLDKEVVAPFARVKEQAQWEIPELVNRLREKFAEADRQRQAIAVKLRDAVADPAKASASAADDDRRITIQADKTIDILTIKKIMQTLKSAGASEMNFAVIKEDTAS